MSDDLKILATTHRLLHDVITVLSNPETNGESFEIGCRKKSEGVQSQIYDALSAIFRHVEDVKVKTRVEDHIVYIERESSKVVVSTS
jgi:hypothetical protein